LIQHTPDRRFCPNPRRRAMAPAGIRFGLSLALIWGSDTALEQSPSALAKVSGEKERL
jgi:hypothetical protein